MSKTSIQSPVLSSAKGLRAKEDQTGQSQEEDKSFECVKTQGQSQACLKTQNLGCTQTRGSKDQSLEQTSKTLKRKNKNLKTDLKQASKVKKIGLSLLTLSLLGSQALANEHRGTDYTYHTVVNSNTYYQVVYQSIDNLPGGFIVLPDGKGRKRGGENNRDFFIKGNFLFLDIPFNSPIIGNNTIDSAIKVKGDARMYRFDSRGIIDATADGSNGIRVESNAKIGSFYNKAGGTISGAGTGITADANASISNFLNNGTIKGYIGLVALGSNFSSDNIFLNSGLIGDDSSALGMYVKNAHMGSLSNEKTVQGSIAGLIINNDNLSDTLPNFINDQANAKITGGTLGMLLNNNGTIDRFYNAALIANTNKNGNKKGDGTAIHIEGSGSIQTFANRGGNIEGTNKGIVLAKNSGSANAIGTFTNTGSIKGSEAAMDIKGSVGTLYNEGLINVKGTKDSMNSHVNAIWSEANIDTFYNTGTIDSQNQGSNDAALRIAKGSINNFINNGTLSVSNANNHTNSAVLINENTTIENFINNGTLKGDAGLSALGNLASNVFLNSGQIGDNSSKLGMYVKNTHMNLFSNVNSIQGDVAGLIINNDTSSTIGTFNNKNSQANISGNTLGMLINNDGTIANFSNDGTIKGGNDSSGDAGVRIEGSGSIQTFANRGGNIEGTNKGIVLAKNSGSANAIGTFTNTGSIKGSEAAMDIKGSVGTLYNEGLINVKGTKDSMNSHVNAIWSEANIDTFYNTGTIDSQNQGSNDAALRIAKGSINNFINNGTLSVSNANNHTNSAVLINENTTIENFINNGTLKGDAGLSALGNLASNVFLNSGQIGDNSSKLGMYVKNTHMNLFSNVNSIQGDVAGLIINNDTSSTIGTFNNKNSQANISGNTLGMLINNDGTIANFSNDGTIKGGNDSSGDAGVRIEGSGSIQTFANRGGNIEGERFGVWVGANSGSSNTIANFYNSGTIKGSKGSGAKIANMKHFINVGNISGEGGLISTGTLDALMNTGTIDSKANNTNASIMMLKNDNTKAHTTLLYNQGLLKSKTHGILVESGNTIEALVNGGTIETDKDGIAFFSKDTQENNTPMIGALILDSGSSIKAKENGINVDFLTGSTTKQTRNTRSTDGINNIQASLDSIRVGKNASIKANKAGINIGKNESVHKISILGEVSGNGEGAIVNKGIIIGKNAPEELKQQSRSGQTTDTTNNTAIEITGTITGSKAGILNEGLIAKDIEISGSINSSKAVVNKGLITGRINIKDEARLSSIENTLYMSEITTQSTNDLSFNNTGILSEGITNAGTGTINISNSGILNKGITNSGTGTIKIINNGEVRITKESEYAITNSGTGSVEVKEWTVRTGKDGKLRALSVGGSKADKVYVDNLIIDQSNLDLKLLEDTNNVISGVKAGNVKNVRTNGGGELQISYDRISGRLSTDFYLNSSIAGALFRNLSATNIKRTAFINGVMKNTMAGFSLDKTQKLALNKGDSKAGYASANTTGAYTYKESAYNTYKVNKDSTYDIAKGEYSYDKSLDYDRTISSRFNNEGSDSKALASNLYADASNILASSNIGEASDFLLADTRNILPSSRFNSGGSIGGSALDYRGSLGFNTGLDQEIKEHAFMILPYFSSLSTELSLNEESKGHTKGVISAYSTLKESGIYGLYAGYEDTSMESTYFDVKNRTYYGGLRYFTSLYGGSLNESLDYELYLRAGGKAAFIKNNVLKKIDTNKAGAKPNTYAYGANVDMGLNFILDSHVFSPELGLVYEGSYTKAYTMNNLVGTATVANGERMYKNQYNLFSTKASVTWFEDWLPHLKTSLELGAKFNLNPTITFKGRFGSRKASEEIELASVEGFLNAALILPLNPSFYMSLNYSGMSSSKDTIHTGFAQFSYLW